MRSEPWSAHTAGPGAGAGGPSTGASWGPRLAPKCRLHTRLWRVVVGDPPGWDAAWRLDVRVPGSPGPERCGRPKWPPRRSHVLFPRVRRDRGWLPQLPLGPEALARPKGQPQKARMLSRLVGARGRRGVRAPEPWECFPNKSTCFRNPGSGGVQHLCCKHLPSRHLPCAAPGMLDSEAPVPSAQGERGSRGRPVPRR